MTRVTAYAQSATPTPSIYLSDNAPTYERAIRRALNNSNKLMPNRSLEPCVASHNLNIRITNPTQRHAHQSLILALRLRDISDRQAVLFVTKGKHLLKAEYRIQESEFRIKEKQKTGLSLIPF